MRQLATIQLIKDIQPIDGADAIEVATVNGWKVVVKKGEYKPGDKIVYLEIDSWVPNTLAPFLSKGKEPRIYQGVSGERLRTISLRKQISQGLILPISSIPTYQVVAGSEYYSSGDSETITLIPLLGDHAIGNDVSELLNIIKWEQEIPAQLRGQAKGNFPSFLRKTDEERVQNLVNLLPNMVGIRFNLHEKLDGSSTTIFRNNGEFGVCSRNLNLKDTEGNSFWHIAKKYNLHETLDDNICIQGELVGPGVQKNKYNLTELDLYVFNVFDISTGQYMDTEDAKRIAERLCLRWVPFIQDYTITESTTVEELLSIAEGPSVLNASTEREGLVWRPYAEQEMRNLGRLSFKTISNKFLLCGGD
jgi:RNA ligase (TIGR02306 family)